MVENNIGLNFKQYDGAKILSSNIGDNCVVGENSFIKNCLLFNNVHIERRNMIFDSIIGSYSYTGYNTVIKHAKIGKFSSISWNVSIGGANHNITHLSTHPFPFISKFGLVKSTENYDSFDEELIIGNDVWIGSNVCILRGCHIGDGAIIGAGAVVTHDVGPYEIWAGVPAKRIGQRFADEIIYKLEKMAWWDFSPEFLSENVSLFKKELTSEMIDDILSKAAEKKES